jgi:hypothetical protein
MIVVIIRFPSAEIKSLYIVFIKIVPRIFRLGIVSENPVFPVNAVNKRERKRKFLNNRSPLDIDQIDIAMITVREENSIRTRPQDVNIIQPALAYKLANLGGQFEIDFLKDKLLAMRPRNARREKK